MVLTRIFFVLSVLVVPQVIDVSTAFAQQPNQITWADRDTRVRLDETLVNPVHLDMLGYARDYATARGGDRNSVSVYLVSNNAYGWRMRYTVRGVWRVDHFYSMLDVARWQGQKNYGTRVRNYGIYFTTFNSPYAWRGIYILRR